MNSLVTGGDYVRALSAADDDRLCRAAFLELALDESGERLRLAPGRLIELAVDDGCFRDDVGLCSRR